MSLCIAPSLSSTRPVSELQKNRENLSAHQRRKQAWTGEAGGEQPEGRMRSTAGGIAMLAVIAVIAVIAVLLVTPVALRCGAASPARW